MSSARASFVTHLEAAIDGTRLPHDRLQTMHADRPLWVRYDLEAVSRSVTKEMLAKRPLDMWRFRELLPVPSSCETVSLGESQTPLLTCGELGSRLGLEHLWIKDESRLPTGSFKSRGLAMAITMAKHFGVNGVALPSAGNAGGAAAAYAARAGMSCHVFMPDDTPIVNVLESRLAGAKTYLVNGLINDCGRIVREGKGKRNWFDLSTLKEPYRIEGKKTMGLELAEQFDWKLPDVILYPTGGGTGLIGMWKAFAELKAIGWLDPSVTRLPRMISVQSKGCAPIATAYANGTRHAEPFPNAATIASGIRVPVAVGDFMILDAVRESGGTAIAIDEETIRPWMGRVTAAEGIAICPETAACFEALERLQETGAIQSHERVVVFNTGAAQKYMEAMVAEVPDIDISQPIDWDAID